MARYVTVAQVEVDETGRLLAEIDENNRIPERDVENMPKPIPFVRYAVVDRGRRNHTVYSNYDLHDVVETTASFNRGVEERRSQRLSEVEGE